MLVPSGNVALASAPASSNAFVAATAPARTANAERRELARRLARVALGAGFEQRRDRRRRCSRPPPTSARSARRGSRSHRRRRRPRSKPRSSRRRPCARPSSATSRPRRTSRADRRRPRAARASPRHRRSRRRDTRAARRSDSPRPRRRRPRAASATLSTLAAVHGPMQRGRAVGVGLVRIGAVGQQLRSSTRAVLGGREQRPRSAADADARRESTPAAGAASAHAFGGYASSTRPVLSPSDSSGTPTPIEQRQQQVRHRRVARLDVGAAAAGRPAGPPTTASGRSKCACKFGLPNAPPYKNSEWSSNVPSPSGVDASLLKNAREQIRLIGIELRVTLDVLGLLLVVRHRVMALREADLGISAEIELAAEHERHDAREVRLEREPLELVHELHVLAERLRNAGRALERRQPRFVAEPLDRLECAARPRARTRDTRRLARDPPARASRVKRAKSAPTKSRMLRSWRACAARCSFVPPLPNKRSNTTRGLFSLGMRRRRRAPRQRVQVDAAVRAVAHAREHAQDRSRARATAARSPCRAPAPRAGRPTLRTRCRRLPCACSARRSATPRSPSCDRPSRRPRRWPRPLSDRCR